MSEKDLEQQIQTNEVDIEKEIKRLQFILNIYSIIPKSNEKNLILNHLKALYHLGVINVSCMSKWAENFDKGKRDDSEIIKSLSYGLFTTLFKNSPGFKFLSLSIDQIGKSILDTYLKKTKKEEKIKIENYDGPEVDFERLVENHFLGLNASLHMEKLILDEDKNLSSEERRILDKISSHSDWFEPLTCLNKKKRLDEIVTSLIKEGDKFREGGWLDEPANYKKSKRAYKAASILAFEVLKKLNEIEMAKRDANKGLLFAEYTCYSRLLKDALTYCDFLSLRRKKDYDQMKHILNQKFPLKQGLTKSEIIKIYKNLKNFENDTLTKKLEFQDKFFKHSFKENPEDLKAFSLASSERRSFLNSLLAFKTHYSKLAKLLKSINDVNLNNVLSKIYTRYSTYTPYKLKYLNKAIELDKTNLEAFYELAKYYKGKNKEKKSLENWKNLSKTYFEITKQKRFKKDEEGLLKISNHPYIFEKLLVKRSKKDLSKEFLITKLTYDTVPKKSITSKPIDYFKGVDGYDYIILRRVSDEFKSGTDYVSVNVSCSLDSIITYLGGLEPNEEAFSKIEWISEEEIKNNFKVTCLKKVIDALINIQKHGQSLKNHLLEYNYGVKLRKKLDKLSPNNAETLYEKCSFLLTYLNNQPYDFNHCDFHLNNILEIGGTFCTLDYGNAALASKLFDITYLLEQEALNLDNGQKKLLFNYFLKKSKMEIADKYQAYDYHALYINLLGASTFSDGRQQKYLMQANEIIDKMGAYSQGSELKQLGELKKGLYKL